MSKLIAISLAAAAQMAVLPQALAFPDGSKELTASELQQRLADKVFSVALKDGTKWRLEFRGGYVFVDTSKGYRTSGKWFTEAGSLCTELQGRGRTCNEARLLDNVLHLKRDTGEIVQYLHQ